MPPDFTITIESERPGRTAWFAQVMSEGVVVFMVSGTRSLVVGALGDWLASVDNTVETVERWKL